MTDLLKEINRKRGKKTGLQFITRTAVLLAIVLVVQSLRLPNYFTGPVVNAVLIISVLFVGSGSGIIIGCITPLVAVLMGIIPPAAVPLVPIIMFANIILVIFFYLFNKLNKYLAWIVAAAAKFAVFYFCINFLLQIFDIKLPAALLVAFQIPQFYTALLGGFIAIVIAKYLKHVI